MDRSDLPCPETVQGMARGIVPGSLAQVAEVGSTEVHPAQCPRRQDSWSCTGVHSH